METASEKRWNASQLQVLNEIEAVYCAYVQAATPGERRDYLAWLRRLYIKNIDERLIFEPELFMVPPPQTLVFSERERPVQVFKQKMSYWGVVFGAGIGGVGGWLLAFLLS